MSSILELGWDGFFASQMTDEDNGVMDVARVVGDYGRAWRLDGAFDGLAEAAGSIRGDGPWPVVGDWVLVRRGAGRRGLVHRVLARRTALARHRPGATQATQILAANIDVVFVVTSFNEDLSANRIERYLAAVWEAGAQPIVLVNKSDLTGDAEAPIHGLRSRLGLADVHAVSAVAHDGMTPIAQYLAAGRTIALVGSSGVGKSTLINALVRDGAARTTPVRETDGKGRHTTTARSLVRLPGGALLVDTPGMRELQPTLSAGDLQHTFSDIDALAAECRFGDCAHDAEPGCAVIAAVDAGRLDRERLVNFRRMAAEAAFEAAKHDKAAAAAAKRRWKEITRAQRAFYKGNEG